jgi:hypothetical protein
MQHNEELILKVVNTCLDENLSFNNNYEENKMLKNKIDELNKQINHLIKEKTDIINYIQLLIKEKDDMINQNKLIINEKEEIIKNAEILIKQKDEIIRQKDNNNSINMNNINNLNKLNINLTKKITNTETFNVFLLNMCNIIMPSLNKEMNGQFNKLITTGYAQFLVNNKGL